MIELPNLIGNQHIKNILGKMFHAYIISGPDGSGKHTLLDDMTAAFLCESEKKPCGVCRQCRKFYSGNHTDVLRIAPDIKVAELRSVIASIDYYPNDAAHRVIICDGADGLSAVAQNVLLKTIEEPPSFDIFILLTSKPDSILDTVRSRCMELRMSPLSESEIITFLNKNEFSSYSEEEKISAAALSGGYLGKAVSSLEGGNTEAMAVCRKFAESLVNKDVYSMIYYCPMKDKNKNSLKLFVDTLLLYFSFHLNALCSGTSVSLCVPQIMGLGEKRLVSLCRRLERISDALQYNVNPNIWSSKVVKECLDACWRYV